MPPNLEIERKFLVDVKKLPKLEKCDCIRIKQGYICTKPTVRIRVQHLLQSTKPGEPVDHVYKAFLTVKGKGKLTKTELETEIDTDVARGLILQFCPTTITKDRYIIPVKSKSGVTHFWELDYFKALDFWMAEIELQAEDESFNKPKWVTEEVTFKPGFSNVELAEKAMALAKEKDSSKTL
jgi:adenylate cyclase